MFVGILVIFTSAKPVNGKVLAVRAYAVANGGAGGT